MPGPTPKLLDSDVRELREAIHDITVEVEKLTAGFRTIKWLVGLTLVASLSGICGGIWWAATINANLRTLEVRLDKFEDKVESRFGKLEAKMDAYFDKLEALIVKARPLIPIEAR